MKEHNGKNETKDTPQLELFNAESASQATPGKEKQDSKIISLTDHKHQQDIKKFYDAAGKLTSHLK
ncbi:MAG TPA: hypothetical protein VHW43_13225 [Puia sp.]|jgi:hypothetical protein|nr:hypothetical protein [Puia sp.]